MAFTKRCWLARLTWPVTHYIVTNLSVLVAVIFFGVFNRIVIVGRKNVPQKVNTLLLSNHQSMLDSWLVGSFAFYPQTLLRPSLLPWNPAAEENFFSNPLLAWLSYNWKCIPIKQGRKDVGAIFRMAEALRKGPMTLFPEGTRSRDGSIGKARGGAGLLVLETQPSVVPVCIDGMNEVLPVGSFIPRIFKRIYVYFGEPMDLSDFYGREKSKELSQQIMKRVMDRVRVMKSEIESIKAEKKMVNLIAGKKYKSQKA